MLFYMVKGHLTGCGYMGTVLFPLFINGQYNIAVYITFWFMYIYIYITLYIT